MDEPSGGAAAAAPPVSRGSGAKEFGPEMGAGEEGLGGEEDKKEAARSSVIKVPVGLPPGSMTRNLMRGGKEAAQATLELHRRYYHERAHVLQEAFRKAGVPEEVVAAVPEALRHCKLCRDRDLPPLRAKVSLKLEVRPNGTLHVDLLFIRLFAEHIDDDDAPLLCPETVVLHMVDEATRFRMGVEVSGKSVGALKAGLNVWVMVFGFPERLETDEESAMLSEPMRVWLELNNF